MAPSMALPLHVHRMCCRLLHLGVLAVFLFILISCSVQQVSSLKCYQCSDVPSKNHRDYKCSERRFRYAKSDPTVVEEGKYGDKCLLCSTQTVDHRKCSSCASRVRSNPELDIHRECITSRDSEYRQARVGCKQHTDSRTGEVESTCYCNVDHCNARKMSSDDDGKTGDVDDGMDSATEASVTPTTGLILTTFMATLLQISYCLLLQ